MNAKRKQELERAFLRTIVRLRCVPWEKLRKTFGLADHCHFCKAQQVSFFGCGTCPISYCATQIEYRMVYRAVFDIALWNREVIKLAIDKLYHERADWRASF